jgi:nitroreductase
MFNIIKKMLPEPIRFKIRFLQQFPRHFHDFFYDFNHYTKYSGSVHPYRSKSNLQSNIIILYHGLEKGLSLRNPRQDFGIQRSYDLLMKLEKYISRFGYDSTAVIAINVLTKYYEFRVKNGTADLKFLKNLSHLRENIPNEYSTEDRGGIIYVEKKKIHESVMSNFENFVKSRYSIRNFSSEPVDDKLIHQAISIATKTPSVCNRQTTKVYIIQNNALRKLILELQPGNRGFGEEIDKILLITSELGYFTHSAERREPFIGGGMFAMSLVYALHSLGLGTCCLNLSLHHKSETIIKKAANISDSEVLIMLIAVGNIPDELKVASSPRRNIDEIFAIR